MKKFNPDFGMKKFAAFVIKYRLPVVIVFALMSVACAIAIPFTKIVYDVSTYLPDESTSAIGLSLLKKEFGDKGMTYLILPDVTIDEAKEVMTSVKETEGVSNVIFEESTGYNEETGSALLTITLDDYDSTEGCFNTMKRLTDFAESRNGALVGQSASSYYTKLETEASILKIGVVIVVVILIMLLITSKSYFELVPLLLNFGVAVLLNMGTNFLFNGISYISNLVGLVLQLALSIDYSVILIHRYVEERESGLTPKEAAIEAQRKGIPEILSSSLTTIAGLAALMFMTLGIGVEMGLSLAKGIFFSLLSVIFLLPTLLVFFAKPLEKSRHKSFLPNIAKPTQCILKARKVIVPLFLILTILAGVGQNFNNYSFNMNGGAMIEKGQSLAMETGFGTMNTLVVVVPNDGDYEKQRQVATYIESHEVIDSSTALASIEIAGGVYLTDTIGKESISTMPVALMPEDIDGPTRIFITAAAEVLFSEYCTDKGLDENSAKVPLVDLLIYAESSDTFGDVIPDEYHAMLSDLAYAKSNLTAENYVRMTFNINSGVEDERAFALIKELKTGLSDYYDEYYMTGETVVCYDMSEYFPRDNRNISLFTLAFILLILFITFKNIILPLILALAIQGGIWINFVIPFLMHGPLCFIGYLLITAVQMGATIDYAIVLTNRYNTIRNNYTDRYQAMAESLNAVFPTIITSGVILTVTGFTLALASSGVVSKMGSLLGSGTALSMGIVLIVLPSLLLVTERITDKCYFNTLFKRGKK